MAKAKAKPRKKAPRATDQGAAQPAAPIPTVPPKGRAGQPRSDIGRGADHGADVDTGEQALEDIIRSLPTGSMLSLSRMNERGTPVYLCELAPETVTYPFFVENFGGGRYRGRWRSNGQWGRRFRLDVDPRVAAKLPTWLRENPAAAREQRPDNAPAGELDRTILDLHQKELIDLVETNARARNEQQKGVSEMVKGVMESTTRLVDTVQARTAAPAADTITKADLIEAIREMRQPAVDPLAELERLEKFHERVYGKGARRGAPEPDDAGGALDAEAIREIIREEMGANGGGSSRGGLSGMLENILTQVIAANAPTILRSFLTPGKPAIAPAPGADPAAAGGDQAPPPNANDELERDMFNFQSVMLSSTLDAAQRGDDPKEFAISLYNMTPTMARGRLRESLQSPTAADDLIGLVPDFAPYRGWLVTLLDELRDFFSIEKPAAPATPPKK